LFKYCGRCVRIKWEKTSGFAFDGVVVSNESV
jgi:hypothetical protein